MPKNHALKKQPICWQNGSIKPAHQATVSVFDHGFLYGDGVFEGIRFYHHTPFRLDEHLSRLAASAQAIALTMPLSHAQWRDAVRQTIAHAPSAHGYLRLIVTRGEGSLGINPQSCAKPNALIIADEVQVVSQASRQQGADIIIASTRKPAADALNPRIKSMNYLNPILARIEANHAGADEALMLNAHGFIAEGSADNVFIVQGNRVITPPVSDGALAGITRAVILELAREAGLQAVEQSITAYDVYHADACFLTGTGAELIPVRSVDGRTLRSCPGKIFETLATRFAQTIEKECAS